VFATSINSMGLKRAQPMASRYKITPAIDGDDS
jgi:hypothetical protein